MFQVIVTMSTKKLSALEEKANRVAQIVHTLWEKHGTLFNSIQYRLWAEMVDIGTHRYFTSCITIYSA